MAEVKWIKIVTDVFDDEKILMIESMPESDSIIVIWFKLLCLAGKQNNSGVFQLGQMPYTDEMFSTIFRRPLNTIRLALKTFEQFEMIEIINNTVTIPNWDRHQSLDAYEKKKARDRLYQAERRANQKLLAEKSSDKSSDIVVSDKRRKEEDKKESRLEGEVVGILTTDAYSELCETIGQADTDYYIQRVKAFRDKKPDAIFNAKATILKWHREDAQKETKKQSSIMEDYHAMQNTIIEGGLFD